MRYLFHLHKKLYVFELRLFFLSVISHDHVIHSRPMGHLILYIYQERPGRLHRNRITFAREEFKYVIHYE